jgi:hypothetical protein
LFSFAIEGRLVFQVRIQQVTESDSQLAFGSVGFAGPMLTSFYMGVDPNFVLAPAATAADITVGITAEAKQQVASGAAA